MAKLVKFIQSHVYLNGNLSVDRQVLWTVSSCVGTYHFFFVGGSEFEEEQKKSRFDNGGKGITNSSRKEYVF